MHSDKQKAREAPIGLLGDLPALNQIILSHCKDERPRSSVVWKNAQ